MNNKNETKREYTVYTNQPSSFFPNRKPFAVGYRVVKNGKATGRAFGLGEFDTEAQAETAITTHQEAK